MNRIKKLLEEKPNNILSFFFTAGFPELNDTVEILKGLEAKGIDMVEIGIPFSDPLADGKTIQKSSERAIENGMNLHLLLEQLADVRKIIKMPLLLMGYYNSVLAYGLPQFLKKISTIGIDGVIIPDMPLFEYLKYQKLYAEAHISQVFMISPETENERIKEIEKHTKDFIYVMSSTNVTGGEKSFSEAQIAFYKRLKTLNLNKKLALGFGISNQYNYNISKKYFPISIIGSTFVNALFCEDNALLAIDKALKEIGQNIH